MEKFKLEPGEVVLKKGGMTYWPPETKGMGALKAAFKAKQCAAFLTSARLAGCTKLVLFPWGPLIWLIMAMMGRKIIFEVPLAAVKRLEKSEGNQQFIITSADGSECTIGFDALFDARSKWLQAIADAITAADPNAKVNATDNVVEIERS